jgi:hypothetical protein
MSDEKQTEKRKPRRTFAQEMQEAFTDWVKKLPFFKRDVPENPEKANGDGPAGKPLAHGR